ncbi:hypothetical protein [Streptomyces sp. NPDC001635]
MDPRGWPAKGSYQGPKKGSLHVLPHHDATKLGVADVVLTGQPVTGGRGKVRFGVHSLPSHRLTTGNYADRLHLVKLPTCALTTPQRTACRTQASLATDHDRPAHHWTG